MKRPNHYTVLNVIQAAAADVDLSTGLMTITGIEKPIRITDCRNFSKTSYAPGTASVKTVTLTAGVTLAAALEYKLTVRQAKSERQRVYYAFAPTGAALTAADLALELRDRINAELSENAIVSAAAAAGVLTLTLLDVEKGDFTVELTASGALQSPAVAATTPYVAPAGTPNLLRELLNLPAGAANQQIDDQGEYTVYTINAIEPNRHNEVRGQFVGADVRYVIALEENHAEFGDLEDEIDDILGGAATEADYLGVPEV